MSKIKILSIFLLLLFCGSVLFAQEFLFEKYGEKVEANLLFPYDLFIFAKNAEYAEYQLSLEVKDSRRKHVLSKEIRLSIPKRDWLDQCAVPVFQSWELAQDSYTLNVFLKNKHLGDKQSFSKSFKIGDNDTEIGLAYIIAEKEGFEYIPQELELDLPDRLTLRQRFSLDIQQIIIEADSERSLFYNPESPFELELTEFFEQDKIDEMAVYLDEQNIRYKVEPLLYRAWFSFSRKYSLKDQMQQIRYIATQTQWKTLRKVPKDMYEEAIESFWQVKDPTPGTLRNETREFFNKRVLEADQRFSIHKRMPGWKSDRGRIYIKFGEPDQVVSEAFPIGRPPSIVWHYFKLNRSFVFEDDKGFGQYRLKNKEEEYEDL